MDLKNLLMIAISLSLPPSLPLVCQETMSDTPRRPAVEYQFFDNRGCIPGKVEVSFKPEASLDQIEAFHKSFGLEPRTGMRSLVQTRETGTFGKKVSIGEQLTVPVGTEEFWVRVFSQHPLVQKAEFVPLYTASVDDFVVRDLNKHYPFTEKSGSIKQNLPTSGILRTMLQTRYLAKKSQPQILKFDTNLLAIQVRGLRGEIIPGAHYWEQIERLTVVSFVAGKQLKLFTSLDGSYATSLGAPPASNAFSSLEPKYSKEAESYVEALTEDMLTELRNKGVIQ